MAKRESRKRRAVAADGTPLVPGTRAHRSWAMSRVRGKDTKPEMIVRRMLHSLGYRYRLHRSGLPGRPDLVFGPRRKVIFVHGCFWHRHDVPGCKAARLPKTRTEYWESKLRANAERDERNVRLLIAEGWDVETVWECELRDPAGLRDRLVAFLEGSAAQ